MHLFILFVSTIGFNFSMKCENAYDTICFNKVMKIIILLCLHIDNVDDRRRINSTQFSLDKNNALLPIPLILWK